MHKDMLELVDVRNFKYIYFHTGNDIGDTSVCILVEESFVFEDGDYELRKSKPAYKRLYKMLVDAVTSGDAAVEVESN